MEGLAYHLEVVYIEHHCLPENFEISNDHSKKFDYIHLQKGFFYKKIHVDGGLCMMLCITWWFLKMELMAFPR